VSTILQIAPNLLAAAKMRSWCFRLLACVGGVQTREQSSRCICTGRIRASLRTETGTGATIVLLPAAAVHYETPGIVRRS